MKRFATMLMMTVLALPALAEKTIVEKMAGRWETTTRSKGGVGQTFEFQPKGVLTITPGAMVDAKFVREGSTVTTTMPDGSAALFEIEINGNQLARTANNTAVKMSRVGKPAEGDDALAGVWSYEYNLGGPAYEIFTNRGTYHFRYPFLKAVQTVEYVMKGDLMTMKYTDGRKLVVTPSFDEDGALLLTDDLGKAARYVRAPY